MSKEDLIPIKSKERARELGRKGGLANKGNPKTIASAKLRWLRERGVNDKAAEKLITMYDNGDINDVEFLAFIQSWKQKCKDIKDVGVVGRLWLDWSKKVHGTFDKGLTQVNIQNNTQVNIDSGERQIKERAIEVLKEVRSENKRGRFKGNNSKAGRKRIE